MKKYKVVTLGCRTNQYESEGYRDQLEKLGLSEAFDEDEADICIVNTCTVTASADQRSTYQINKLVRENPNAKVYVTGCYAERATKELTQIKGVTKVVPNKEKNDLLQYAFPEVEELPEFSIERFSAHTRAFVKVQDGCNSYCSYCIIPLVRGRSRSRSMESVRQEVERLIANGYKEIVLTGINIGDYDGGDGSVRLADLVRMVDGIEGLERLRISSIDPDEVDDDLLHAVTKGRVTCPSMHIVLQSGSNSVLKRMNRKYTKQEFYTTVERLRNASSDFTFTTDVIVGFPGESDRDFEETLEVIRDVKFAKVHMFPYSVRPKTKAARFLDHLPKAVIDERKSEVLRVSEQVAFLLRESYVGKVREVLLESDATGHTDNFLEVLVKGSVNQLCKVQLLENSPEGLIGVIV